MNELKRKITERKSSSFRRIQYFNTFFCRVQQAAIITLFKVYKTIYTSTKFTLPSSNEALSKISLSSSVSFFFPPLLLLLPYITSPSSTASLAPFSFYLKLFHWDPH
ncbi:hypothetical protein AHAS_Ahas02G0212200 [Arachis hypogaea]